MKKTILALLLLVLTMQMWAQRSPQHPMDIPQGKEGFYEVLDAWTPGTPPVGSNPFDDQFYISRVRPLPRIVDGSKYDYDVRSDVDSKRKLCLWVPLDDPTVKWKSLPRYCFEGDNFSMWSYTDIHGNWTAPWMRVTAGISDVAHKNGVKVGCVFSIPWAKTVLAYETNEWGKQFFRLFQKNTDGTYKYSDKLVRLMKYYGIDGLGCNSEFRSNVAFMDELIAFVKDCKAKAKEINWEFQLHWYDGTNDNGGISFDSGLGTHNDGIFGNGATPVTDMMFFNYNWNNGILANSVTKAESMNRSSYDLYAGFDIQGRAFKNSNWTALKNNKISIGLWGAHAQSLLHQSATDDGSSDIAIQQAYLLKQELAFSGGNRNPAVTPAIRNDATLANADLKTFHGLAALLSAKSTLQQLPFVTRFSLGNGLFFNNKGKTTFNHKWYNLNTQDFLPTWRWWITDVADKADEAALPNLIKADFTFDDAWFGGSCLKIHGKTPFSRVKLFKTKITVKPEYTVSITYKMLHAEETKAKLFLGKTSEITLGTPKYREIALPAGKVGEWTTHTFTLSELGLADYDILGMIGLTYENTDDDYGMLLGELVLKNPTQTFATVQPTITKVDILRGRYNQVDFKLFYQSKDDNNGEKTYNDEVGTWYFEIYFQQKDRSEQLLTATTSWAGYVIDAPMDNTGERVGRFGVRAVSPDGSAESPITWSEYMDIPYNEAVETVIADRPVIKPGETFALKYEDNLHTPARKWEIKDPLTGASLATAENSVSVTLAINKEGLYDLYLTDDKGNTTITRGFVQITPEATGAVPQILSFEGDKTTANVNEAVTYTYTSKDGEGNVSRALRIEDPKMFMAPADAQKGMVYSYAVWFMVNKYSHDKQGTNLINKNSIADSWPHNNWGDLWVTIRPQWTGLATHPANEISFNTFGWEAHDSPNENMMSTGFSVTPGVWNHIVVTQDASKRQKMYFNGKKVAETVFNASSRRENSTDSRIDKTQPANIFFGGGGVYKAGFDGWIDDVQIWNKVLTDTEVLECMKGYKTAPEGLTAYYTFEEINSNGTFSNHGKGGILQGKLVKVDGSGGESTATAAYVQVEADNNALGYPGIEGSLPITTSAEWQLEAAKLPTNGVQNKKIIVTYTTAGTFDAGVTVKNGWGKAEKIITDYIVVNNTTGVKNNNVGEAAVYPNPFVDAVNVKFTTGGNYQMEMIDLNGRMVKQDNLQVGNNEIVTIRLQTAPKGVYILHLKQNGVDVATLKVVKR